MEITLVGMNAETSPAFVSIIGRPVSDPPPTLHLLLHNALITLSEDRKRHQDMPLFQEVVLEVMKSDDMQ